MAKGHDHKIVRAIEAHVEVQYYGNLNLNFVG